MSDSKKKIHMIGVGGIGMSALARLYLHQGHEVTGSEASPSTITRELETEGVTVFQKHSVDNIPTHVDIVVYTVAVPEDNVELVEAKSRGVEVFTYAEALGEVSKSYFTVAVSGTHGKTTTTAMIAEIARKAGLDPTVIIGSYLRSPRTNFIPGSSNLFIVEACEYKRSFLSLHPNILVITNIEADHLDYYKDIEDVQRAFSQMLEQVSEDGFVVCNKEDTTVVEVLKTTSHEIVDYMAGDLEVDLKIPGRHNRLNARAALAVARLLGVDDGVSLEALSNFEGTWRRAELKREFENGALLYDDYAHHPSEIKATLAGFRNKFPDRVIRVVFQPHLYSRTKLFMSDFAKSFSDADAVYVVPIYAAREPLDEGVSSEMLVDEMKAEGVSVEFTTPETAYELIKSAEAQDLWITMGAGDIYKIGE